ncbi:MAG: riboflavin synthase [Pseudomonadota bacterium]
MFTGLVEEIGCVSNIGPDGDGFSITISADLVLEDANLGDSISVNGVCLTLTDRTEKTFSVGLAPETLNRTNLGGLEKGATVNLERAALPTTRLGGHYVQGHVDGVGEILSFTPDKDALWLKIKTTPDLMRYVVSKGYIAIDGASLTVVHTGPDWFDVTLIAYSQSKLILPHKTVGDLVNLEVDILAKYVEKLSSSAPANDGRMSAQTSSEMNAETQSSMTSVGA